MGTPRRQAQQLTDWLSRERPSVRAVLLGARRAGKSTLLAQMRQLLFDAADGPLPFWFCFEPPSNSDSAEVGRALRFAASFCHQMRAFLLRQKEILSEVPGDLATEIGQAGVPLALNELAQEVVSAVDRGAERTVELVSLLPVRFAHREGRPVCCLWDDCHHLHADSEFWRSLEHARALDAPTSHLLTGSAPRMRELAGRYSWETLQLESLTTREALLLAESMCKECGIRFNRAAWECWLAVSGTSPGWMLPIIESAGMHAHSLESIEQIAELYAQQLDDGSIATWLGERWSLSQEQGLLTRAEVKELALLLANGECASLTQPHENPAIRDERSKNLRLLHQQEWLQLHPLTAESRVSPVEADWLRLEADRAAVGSPRAKARLIQSFLLRTNRAMQRSISTSSTLHLPPDEIASCLTFPANPEMTLETPAGDLLRLPKIFSVAREETGEAQLYWAYGQTYLSRTKKKHSSPAGGARTVPMVLLLACSNENPTKVHIDEWNRRLQREITSPAYSTCTTITELWVVVPDGASLAPTAGEKRLTPGMLAQLLKSAVAAEDPEPRPASVDSVSSEPSMQEIGQRLLDLQARAQQYHQELMEMDADRAQEVSQHRVPAQLPEPAVGRAAHANTDEYLRRALSLSLMLASADLVATGSGAGGASHEAHLALVELQAKCQQLLDDLHKSSMIRTEPNS